MDVNVVLEVFGSNAISTCRYEYVEVVSCDGEGGGGTYCTYLIRKHPQSPPPPPYLVRGYLEPEPRIP